MRRLIVDLPALNHHCQLILHWIGIMRSIMLVKEFSLLDVMVTKVIVFFPSGEDVRVFDGVYDVRRCDGEWHRSMALACVWLYRDIVYPTNLNAI